MNPLALLIGGGAIWGISHLLKKPGPENFQGAPVPSSTALAGTTVHVVTPIPPAVTHAQASATPIKPPIPTASTQQPVPHITTAQGVVYSPPAAVTEIAPGVVQLAPIVISGTPGGTAYSSSVAISSLLDVQRALNTLGYRPALNEDGKLGPATIGNIKQFQGKVGITVDGNAGPTTKAKLSEALTKLAASGPGTSAVQAAVASDTFTATAPSTAVNTAVVTNKDIQHALNLLGASPPLQEDGALGPKSVAAIKTFQITHGLTPDGVAGPKTKTGLSAALAAKGVSMHGEYGYGFGYQEKTSQLGSCWA